MKTVRIALAGIIALALSTGLHLTAKDKDNNQGERGNKLRATLIGFNEVPSVSTPARGHFEARIVKNSLGEPEAIEYSLTFSDLSSTTQQSHIHFAQPAVNGGIVLWLCQGAVRAPAAAGDVPECPAKEGGTVTGTLTPNEVLPTAATQQIAAGEFAEVIAAIRAGFAYANVHSATSPGGEIRGQLQANGEEGRDH